MRLSPSIEAALPTRIGAEVMQKNGHGAELVLHHQGHVDHARRSNERWSMPVATLFIVSASLVMWGGIYLLARTIFS